MHEDARADSRPAAPGQDDELASVLLIDADAVFSETWTRAIRDWGYHVIPVESADAALAVLADRFIAVVICDAALASDGYPRVSRLLRDLTPTPRLIALVGGDARAATVDGGVQPIGVLMRPIEAERLRTLVRTGADELQTAVAQWGGAIPRETAAASRAGHACEAEYYLESPVKCPSCNESIRTIEAVRLIRGKVNFTSMLPRRGRVLVCPVCLAILPAQLANF